MPTMLSCLGLLAAALALDAVHAGAQGLAKGLKSAAVFTLASPAFADNGTLPVKYSCDGEGVRPPLEWAKFPNGTRSFVLVLDDASNRRTSWSRWVVYGIPATVTSLPEGAPLPEGIREGRSDWDKPGYDPPCAEKGKREYVVTLFALNAVLPELGPDATRADVLNATDGKVIGWGRLSFSYERAQRAR